MSPFLGIWTSLCARALCKAAADAGAALASALSGPVVLPTVENADLAAPGAQMLRDPAADAADPEPEPPSTQPRPPLAVTEPLQLSAPRSSVGCEGLADLPSWWCVARLGLCEAFYLVFALDALVVRATAEGAALSPAQLWARCVAADAAFVKAYAVYHFLRSRGWVPRSGLKFGADFLAYRRGPRHFHSRFGLLFSPDDAPSRMNRASSPASRCSRGWSTRRP